MSDLIRGNQLLRSGKIEEAVAAYLSAIAHNPSFHWSHYKLGEALEKLGRWEDAIAADQKAVELKPTWERARDKLEQLLAQIHHTNEASAYFQSSQQHQPKTNEVCEYLWKGLNDLGPLDQSGVYCQAEIQWLDALEYFTETSHYQVIAIDCLAESEKEFLEQFGFDITALQQIFLSSDLSVEESYINSFNPNQEIHLSRITQKKHWERWRFYEVTQDIDFQQSGVETGYIYSICPISRKVLRSNQSFYVGGNSFFSPLIYRFVGVNVFYLIVGGWGGSKRFLYFPHLDLILRRTHDQWLLEGNQYKKMLDTFKSYAVSCWSLLKSYMANNNQKETLALCGFVSNIGHFFWNDMSGIYHLFSNQIFHKIDKFLVGPYEYFSVAHIFQESPPEKFIHITETGIDLFKTLLSSNYFCLRLTDLEVKEKLANRVIQASVKRASPAFLQELEQARKHFPIIWVGCRSRNRVWLSQVEGTANLIKSLYSEFPNLAVVFGGWSPKESEEATPWEIGYLKAPIETFVKQVLDLIPPYIQTYNAFGRPNYENILLCNAIDLYVAPFGSETAYLSMIVNKPGVIHANSDHSSRSSLEPIFVEARENCIAPASIDRKYIVDQDNSNLMTRNYDFDWQLIYHEAMKLIQQSIINQAKGHNR